MSEEDLDVDNVEEDISIDDAVDSSMDSAFERLESESEAPLVEGDLDANQEVVEEAEELPEGEEAPLEQTPEEYLEELKGIEGQEKKAQQFEKLVGSNQELKAQVEQLAPKGEQLDSIMSQIVGDAGLSVESFTDFIDVFAAVKDGRSSPELQQKVNAFALRLAQTGMLDMNSINQYAGHDDILQRVQNLELTERDAQELIQHREIQRQQQSTAQAQQQFQQQEQQFESDKNAAIQNVTQLSQQLASQNADHAQIEDLIKQSYWDWAQQGNPPSSWLGEYQRLYSIAANSVKATATQAKQSSDTPMSPNGKSPTQELPKWTEESMLDHAMARMQQEG